MIASGSSMLASPVEARACFWYLCDRQHSRQQGSSQLQLYVEADILRVEKATHARIVEM
jgi:hypothetical protein